MKIVAVLYPAGPLGTENPALLGCAENALGLHEFLEGLGHELVVLTDKEKTLDEHLPSTDILITTPFHPAYVTRERFEKASQLKLVLTAGVGSDHIDLEAAKEFDVTVAEVTGSNVVSVAEHVVMQILILVRNFIPAYQQVISGNWAIAEIAANAHDLENKVVGIVGTGRIGQRVATRLRAFDVSLIYYDARRLSPELEKSLGLSYRNLDALLEESDVISINCPLTPETDGLFNRERLMRMKPGSYLVNTARGRIVDRDALVQAINNGHLSGYAGDVWYPQPASADHPWRAMPHHALTPHYSGTTLEAQKRYSYGIKDSLKRFLSGQPLQTENVIVEGGKVISPSYNLELDDKAVATV